MLYTRGGGILPRVIHSGGDGMKLSQKRAISYAIAKRADKRRDAFLDANDGGLDNFLKSLYKSKFWYILKKFNKRIY